MPDGSRPPAAGLSAQHRTQIALARQTMDDELWARAAVAWLQVVAPDTVPGAAADHEGVSAHLMLFAREANYWARLCVLFGRRRLSDTWGPEL